jgi:nicotinamide-nucleotide amidase
MIQETGKASLVERQRILKVYGPAVHEIAKILEDLPQSKQNVVIETRDHFPEIHITIRLRRDDEPSAVSLLDRIETEIRYLMGPCVFATGEQRMEDVLGEMLRKRHLTISVAESCTGGLIGHLLTNVPGSSDYFLGGMITYSNESKRDLLGVSSKTLETHGAVSNPTVQEMARGVRERLDSNIGLSVSGIAGPAGGTAVKPVGTVHIGLATNDKVLSGKYQFQGTREEIKLNTAMMALDWVRRYLHEDPFLSGI